MPLVARALVCFHSVQCVCISQTNRTRLVRAIKAVANFDLNSAFEGFASLRQDEVWPVSVRAKYSVNIFDIPALTLLSGIELIL